MASTYTTNLNLEKPNGNDDINVQAINGNMDKLDGKVPVIYKKTVSGTTTASGALDSGLNTNIYYILECHRTDAVGFVFWRGDGYMTAFNAQMNILSTTGITVEVTYCKRSILQTP